MPRISVFDMLKIGVGPSSSHTMGPWRAAHRFLIECRSRAPLRQIQRVQVDLYGSLAKTGKGHGTDIAVLMGLKGEDPATCDLQPIPHILETTNSQQEIYLLGVYPIRFVPETDLIFHYDKSLPFHPNGVQFTADLSDGQQISEIYYSVGGGFVVKDKEELTAPSEVTLPYPCDISADLLGHCQQHRLAISDMVWQNELVWRSESEIRSGLLAIWETMASCIYRGCHTSGELPGGLRVMRRAGQLHRKLINGAQYDNQAEWLEHLQQKHISFQDMVKWISCFALAVNEENAAFGRVVTAPTNGAAGVIPAVLMYYVMSYNVTDKDIIRFLLIAGEIGTFFKKGATISAAQGGCQAEIGVSSAMAAAALTECLGGSVEQALMAAEIAMEHHLGLTCDPIGGLVQIPCIERNAMGAMKAITAANIALESLPEHAKVSLDVVIETMWDTAKDMSDKYKETSEGGLAAHILIPVNVIEC